MRIRFPISAALALPLLALAYARGATLRETYFAEARAESAKPTAFDPAPMDARAMARLPEPVRRYFTRCGFLGRAAMRTARLDWSRFEMKRGEDKDWMPVDVRQFNLVPRPARFVYLHSRIGGVLPFNGLDEYRGGHGRMRIRALGMIKIADVRSSHMDASAMATFLAETLFHPSAALQPYLEWQSIDSVSARAVFTDSGRSVSGIFRFNPEGEFIAFETNDRWQDGHEEGPVPWSISAADYRDMGGFRLPTRLTATWHQKDGDFEYFRGQLLRADYDVEEP